MTENYQWSKINTMQSIGSDRGGGGGGALKSPSLQTKLV